jgi:alkanesulfonate monooxygenase SsuD/methylene tetrahydromethanopterin reductase-like flavin-dependent oxidoreductase (luciferase family)
VGASAGSLLAVQGSGVLDPDIHRRAAEAGRDPSTILIFNLQTVIFGETDAKAKAKFEEYKTWVSYEEAMALI